MCSKGVKLVQSSYEAYYLDCGEENMFTSGPNWCPYAMWTNIYANDVLQKLPEECRDNIIGAEVTSWTEQIGDATIHSKLFPRSIALAERLWTDPAETGTYHDVAVWLPALQRMRYVNANLANKCIPTHPLQPQFCLENPEYCDEFTASRIKEQNEEVVMEEL